MSLAREESHIVIAEAVKCEADAATRRWSIFSSPDKMEALTWILVRYFSCCWPPSLVRYPSITFDNFREKV